MVKHNKKNKIRIPIILFLLSGIFILASEFTNWSINQTGYDLYSLRKYNSEFNIYIFPLIIFIFLLILIILLIFLPENLDKLIYLIILIILNLLSIFLIETIGGNAPAIWEYEAIYLSIFSMFLYLIGTFIYVSNKLTKRG